MAGSITEGAKSCFLLIRVHNAMKVYKKKAKQHYVLNWNKYSIRNVQEFVMSFRVLLGLMNEF